MVEYARAKDGCRFVITELGKTVPRINSKFVNSWDTRYDKTVPKKWVDLGYVEEIDVKK